ncbi:MAG: 1-deoxy-D-xylulose-5-phosphate reductoisomerase, partial [Pseudomonadota bacterium]
AANEVAVAAFLEGRIGFMAIAAIVEEALQRLAGRPADTLEHILAADRMARDQALGQVRSRAA